MIIYEKLNKNYILERVSQERIFERYILKHRGISINVIPDGELISSPLRDGDENPSFGFRYKGNKLRAKDFAGYFWGDCFDLVAYFLKLNTNDNIHFNLILEDITKEFSIHKYQGKIFQELVVKDKFVTLPIYKEIDKIVIDVVPRNWNNYDQYYWGGKYQLLPQFLQRNEIYAASVVLINKQPIYEYTPADPCYAYFFGKDEEGRNIFQLYFPERKKYKFLNNKSFVYGLNTAKPARIGILTKSFKDVTNIRHINQITKFDLDAFSVSSESTPITKQEYLIIKSKYDYIFGLSDFDHTGLSLAWKHRKLYDIEPLFINNGYNIYKAKRNKKLQLKYKHKDFSDYKENQGINKTVELLTKFHDYMNTIIEYKEQNKFI